MGCKEIGLADLELVAGSAQQGEADHRQQCEQEQQPFKNHELLMRVLGRPCACASDTLMTIGQACRAVWRETMRNLLSWVAEHLSNHWSLQRIELELQLI